MSGLNATTTGTSVLSSEMATTSQSGIQGSISRRSLADTSTVVVVTITSQQESQSATQAPVVVTQYSTLQYTPSASATTTSPQASNSATASSAHRAQNKGLSTGSIVVAVVV